MGAELWYHSAPWHDSPAEALFDVQVQVLRDKYHDLSAILRTHLESAREAVRITEGNDPYHLLDFYRKELLLLEGLSRQPLPTHPRDQIELIRKLWSSSGQGVGNILDVTDVSDAGGIHIAKRLSPKEIRRVCGVDRPSLRDAFDALLKINEGLGRGESVCFPVYAEAGTGAPVGWYFVGNTLD